MKIKQSRLFLEEIEQFLKDHSGEKLETPLIIAGDFNSLPHSGMYQYYSEGNLSKFHSDFGNFKPKNDLSHPFTLESAYLGLGEPNTNFTAEFCG